MKLSACLLALVSSTALAVLTPTVVDKRFEAIACYNATSLDPTLQYLGGMLFSPDGSFLYIVKEAEDFEATMVKLPVQREPSSGRITGFGSPTSDFSYADPYMDVGFQTGPGGRIYYNKVEEVGGPVVQASLSWSGQQASITKLYEDNITISVTSDEYVWSVSFNPITNKMLIGLDGISIQTSLEFNSALNAYVSNPALEEVFFNESSTLDYVTDLRPVTSGSSLNNLITASYDNGEVLLFDIDGQGTNPTGNPINENTGLPELGTLNLKQTLLFSDLPRPWGVIFDPITNDFLVNTWSSGRDPTEPSAICQFRGFPPTIDVPLVTGNLADATQTISGIASARRLRARRRLGQSLTKAPRASKAPKATKSPKAASAPPQVAGPVAPTTAELEEALLSGNPDVVIEQVDAIFESPGFQAVLDGQPSADFTEELESVTEAVTTVIDNKPADLTPTESAQWDAAAAAATEALNLLKDTQERQRTP